MLLQAKRIVMDYTIPVWGIVVVLLGWAGTVAWIIIDLMFFKKRTNEKISDMETSIQLQKTKSDSDKREMEDHIRVIKSEYSENKELLITLNTKMDLILGNKINFNHNHKGK